MEKDEANANTSRSDKVQRRQVSVFIIYNSPGGSLPDELSGISVWLPPAGVHFGQTGFSNAG
jgi:hypothetical protein